MWKENKQAWEVKTMAGSSTSLNMGNIIFSNVNVLLFEGENYDFLCVKMKTVFLLLDVLEFVEYEFKIPESMTG